VTRLGHSTLLLNSSNSHCFSDYPTTVTVCLTGLCLAKKTYQDFVVCRPDSQVSGQSGSADALCDTKATQPIVHSTYLLTRYPPVLRMCNKLPLHLKLGFFPVCIAYQPGMFIAGYSLQCHSHFPSHHHLTSGCSCLLPAQPLSRACSSQPCDA